MNLLLLPTQQFTIPIVTDLLEKQAIKFEDITVWLWYRDNFFNSICRSKWVFLHATMENYGKELSKQVKVKHFFGDINELVKKKLKWIVINTADILINKEINKLTSVTKIYDTPYFLLNHTQISETNLKTFNSFYRKFRAYYKILMNGNQPIGNKWSMDKENQDTPDHALPPPLVKNNEDWTRWVNKSKTSAYTGIKDTHATIPYATDRNSVLYYLKKFLKDRFADFGPYQDYYDKDNYQNNHSMISMYLNVGLITPAWLIKYIVDYGRKNKIPLNSLEGYIRQLFWREYMYYIYIKENADTSQWFIASKLTVSNYFKNTKNINKKLWYGNTGIEPLDHAISITCQTGYLHHIGRLMYIGSFFLMYGIKPTEMYRWFLSMYIDAYDWVMYGNVFSMLYANSKYMSRPYFSSSRYILKMSNFEKGNWCDRWDAYYHRFLIEKKSILSKVYFVSRWVKYADKNIAKIASDNFEFNINDT